MSGRAPSQDRVGWLARNVLPHEPALRAWLVRRCPADLEIDDVVQESYAILTTMERIDHIDHPRAYFFRTAQNLILQQVRRSRIVAINAVADLEAIELAADEPSPETQVADRQELQRLADALAALPSRCGEAFRLRKVEGLSQREVAERMKLSENTVEKHIGKALKLLMDQLGRGGTAGRRASRSRTGEKAYQDHAARDGQTY